jgi:hypothetical protein
MVAISLTAIFVVGVAIEMRERIWMLAGKASDSGISPWR